MDTQRFANEHGVDIEMYIGEKRRLNSPYPDRYPQNTAVEVIGFDADPLHLLVRFPDGAVERWHPQTLMTIGEQVAGQPRAAGAPRRAPIH